MKGQYFVSMLGLNEILSFDVLKKRIDRLAELSTWENMLIILLRVGLIYVVSRILLFTINRTIDRILDARVKKTGKLLNARRVTTLARLLKNTSSYCVNFIVILLLLGELKIQIAPLLAGAGVVGLAVGFGAQSFIKDIIAGFSIVFEDQFAVDDFIQVGAYKGKVEMIGLRTTHIRSGTGEVHIIPNGSISQVTNYSLNPAIAVVDVFVPEYLSILQITEVLQQNLNQADHPGLLKHPQVLGIESFTSMEIIIRITAQCQYEDVGEIVRFINKKAKMALELLDPA